MVDTGVPKQAPTHWGRVLLTLIIGGVPAAICFILGWWWWGTLFLLLTLLAACFSFSTVAYPIVFTVFAVFAIAWLSGAWLDVALHRGGESAWWRDALPILGGFGIGVALPAIFWFVTLAVGTNWLLGLPDSHEIEWWDAFTFVSTRAFGLARPYVQVENGKMKEPLSMRGLFADSADPGLLTQFGGPGTLVVGEGNVVVLERGGKLSRILGMGTHTLRHGEWFKEPKETKGIHDLRSGGGPPIPVKGVRTKDGVPLEITIGGACKLEPKAITDSRPDSLYAGAESSSEVIGEGTQYPVYEATIRKAVYNTGDKGWQTAYPGRAAGALHEVVSRFTFDQIFPRPGAEDEEVVQDRVIAQIENGIKEAVAKQKAYAMGIVPGRVSIREIKPPEGMQQALLDRWAAPLRTSARLQHAKDKRDMVVLESEGRAKSFEQVEKARREASSKWAPIIEDLWSVLPTADNDLVVLEFVRMVSALVSRIGKDERVARQRIDAMQRIMEDEERLLAADLPSAQYTYTSPADAEQSDKDAE